MARRREAVRVELSERQRQELERLWFYWGNYGPQTTKGNHSFIQGLLERGQDERPLQQKGYLPTKECEEAVERVLRHDEQRQGMKAQRDEAGSCEGVEANMRLRVVRSDVSKLKPNDPGLKEFIHSMRQRAKERDGDGGLDVA